MKGWNIVAIAVASSLFSNIMRAQMSIGPDKIPVAGDQYTTVAVDTTGVQEGIAGSNRTWDFSGLVPSGIPTTIRYVNAQGTSFGEQFPEASLASTVIEGADTSFIYFSISSGRLTSHGYAAANGIMKYSDPEVQMATPLNFNDPFNDQFLGEMNGDGFVIRSRGAISIINDSYGMITLPGGATIPAARVKFVRTTTDTAFVSGMPIFTTQMTITSFEWFTASSKFPVVQIAYYVETINGHTTVRKQVEYNTNQTTGTSEQTGELFPLTMSLEQNYPNPFNPTTQIRFSLSSPASHVTLNVHDVLGREVARLVNGAMNAGEHEVTFNAAQLAAGVYFYTLRAGDTAVTRKLLLTK